MAIPSIPSNFAVQTANGQILLTWDLVAGAISYSVKRSVDGINFTQIATPTPNKYLDTAVTLGTQYFYQIASAATIAAQATATLTFSGQPTNNQTVTIANIVFTAKTAGAVGNQFNIGVDVATTIVNLNAALNMSSNLTNVVTSAATSATVLTLTSFLVGPEGNGLQFSTALSNTVAAPFSGGTVGSLSPYTSAQSAVPTTTGEMCLSQIRLAAKQRADRVNSQFVTDSEWNSYINQSMFELYDLLVDQYEDYFMAPMASFTTTGNVFLYPLPDGITAFTDNNGNPLTAAPFYKLLGVDLALNTANNAYVTMDRFNFVDRNKYLYANSSSTIYGVYNMQYRLMGNQIEFIPTPTAGQKIRLAYIPRLTQLLQDTDITTMGISGWIEYVIVKAAYLALTKEESDTSSLAQQLNALTKRIEDSAMNRDAGRPDTISDVRRYPGGYGGGPFNGGTGGFW